MTLRTPTSRKENRPWAPITFAEIAKEFFLWLLLYIVPQSRKFDAPQQF
jgi:hypothetical protein